MPQEPQNNNPPNESVVPARILQMRELNSRPDGRGKYSASDARLFYIQGRFMSDLSDDFDQYAPLFDSQPTYESMNNYQLRCYFTWRTAIRNKRVTGTGIYYMYLYFFELINNIGVKGPMDALERMAYVIGAYKRDYVNGISIFAAWFRDYYALNNIGAPFSIIIHQMGLSELFPVESWEHEFRYAHTLRISSVDIRDDQFFADFGFYKFIRCYNTVMDNLNVLFKMYGLDMENTLTGVFVTDNSWFPYEHALYYNPAPPGDRVVALNGYEQYICVRGVWNRRVMSYDPLCTSLVDLIIEKIKTIADPHGRNKKTPNSLRNTPFSAVVSDNYFHVIIYSTTKQYMKSPYSNEALRLPADLFEQPDSDVVRKIWKARSISAASNTEMEIARQFVSQAKILAECEDDYREDIPDQMPPYRCIFSMLSISHTRSYLTWRTRYKNGDQMFANYSFGRFYASELINKLGADTDWEVLEKLAALMRCDYEISDIFLDYFITHAGSMTFTDVIERLGVSGYFPNIAIQNKAFKDWFALFSDKPELCREKYPEPEIAPAFNLCIGRLRDCFENAGLTFMVLFLGMDNDRRDRWSAFPDNIYFCDYQDWKESINVTVSDYDTYAFNAADHRWACLSASVINPKSYYLFEYIIKRLTARLHEKAPPKLQLRRVKRIFPPSGAYPAYVSAITGGDFESIIDNAYNGYFQSKKASARVRVDIALLDDIRKSADENLEKLLIDYENTVEPPEAPTFHAAAAETGWDAFCGALNERQRMALAAVAGGKPDKLYELARAENVLPEVLIESINDAALDYTGDYVIEDTDNGPKIIAEYAEALNLLN